MTRARVVAIHQPNFFPWLGYFDKIARADVFVLLDNAQFQKTGGTWTNRVKLVVGGSPAWVTMPVVRAYHGVRSIAAMRIDDRSPWRAKLLQTIRTNYGSAPRFDEVFPMIVEMVNNPTDVVSRFNIGSLTRVARALGLTTPFVLGSTLGVDAHATDLLIATVKAVQGTEYVCGGGATGYQDDDKFAAAGVTLTYQKFEPPEYPQFNRSVFTPGLSILDALMNCGVQETAALLARPAHA
jgi:hypothetical protein